MDLRDTLSQLGLDLLLILGLVTLVSVSFDAPRLIEGQRYELHLRGALTKELTTLVDKAIPVELEFAVDTFLPGGKKQSTAIRHRIEYRSISRSYLVSRGADAQVFGVNQRAAALLAFETLQVERPGNGVRFLRVEARLRLGEAGENWQRQFWGSNQPVYLWEFL